MQRTDIDWLTPIMRGDADVPDVSGSASRFEGLYGRGYSAVIRRAPLRRVAALAWGGAEALRDLDDIVAQVAAQVDEDGAPLLDVPSGQGVAADLLVRAGWHGRLVGVDLARVAVDRARQHAIGLDIDARYVVGTALDLPLRDASVAGIISINGLHVMPDHARFLAELARVLRPGASCWLVTITSGTSLRSRAFVAAGRAIGVLPQAPPTRAQLQRLVDQAGFVVAERIAGSNLVALRLTVPAASR